MPELADVSSDQQNQGLAENLVIDRDTASRLGITAAAIDSVLYDAFGQREVSTMYTSLNQYFVVMEVDPKIPAQPRRAQRNLHQGQQCSRRSDFEADYWPDHSNNRRPRLNYAWGCRRLANRRGRHRGVCRTDSVHRRRHGAALRDRAL